MFMFDEPTEVTMGDKVAMETLVNKLVIVRPIDYVKSKITEFKPDGAEAVFANIALLEPYEGEPWKIFRSVLVMQGYLVGAFKSSLERNLLGTIYLGERKAGQKPPYKFKTLTDNPKAVATATEWMRKNEAEFLKAPAASFAEPAETAGKKPSTLDSMRDQSNPWLNDEPPF